MTSPNQKSAPSGPKSGTKFSATSSAYTSIATLTAQTQTMTVTGAAVTNLVRALDASLADGLIIQRAWVSAVDTVSVTLFNSTAGALVPGAVDFTGELARYTV